MITKINNKVVAGVLSLFLPLSTFLFTSCEDFFEQESDHVIYAGSEHLNNSVDTLYSVAGILSKVQALADRTILFGEVRGDLVDLTNTADADLKNLSLFNVDDNNSYNTPRDYYAVINNCNYFIAHADTALRNSRNDYVFMREFGAVKTIRAWTYLQLALNYGKVPFVTEPILSQEDAEQNYPMYTLEDVCRFFINDLQELTGKYVSEAFDITTATPLYGKMLSIESHFFFYPMSVLLGDLHLWLATLTNNTSEYRQAALAYYNYISRRNGSNSAYPSGTNRLCWPVGASNYLSYREYGYSSDFLSIAEENWTRDNELITVIPGDSLPSDPNYSKLRGFFNSELDNNFQPSIVPSTALINISAAQKYCNINKDATVVTYAPENLSEYRAGDLRLAYAWRQSSNVTVNYGDGDLRTIDSYQQVLKYQTRNIHILRRQMVYLRMAEALNMAGFPRMAFQILSTGLTDEVMDKYVYPTVSKSDSLSMVALNMKFPASYRMFNEKNWAGTTSDNANTMGIHSRGSGYTPMNEYYQLIDSVPDTTDPTKNVAVPLAEKQAYVDSLILNESALEFAFEGTRYYDLMRYALRQSNPGATMQKLVCGRRGEAKRAEVQGELKKDLTNQSNWFISWNGKIGF
ncbi:RagB/SusD family nutrient uptake outer membrane protein [Prevotella sp. E9-3]|uniref:RagB/SusD family nutrient uptake outer membrane protein n=1 Tax=Prevotella sp. E9-3 TaxID=2913621 RepID=UPI001EDA8E46|nr:RagB/SusD family nutrient uptake outer membrane protein [Prevotella sp. E9-3]UKK48572.1 RagB/SusD family nutrient uptake outer membrane protein [Prevotella sp. E9-3]